jgi:hypothetical protein
MLTNMYAHLSELTDAYIGALAIVNKYVENMFSNVYWMPVQGEKAMRLTEPPNNDFPDKMIPLIQHHYSETSKKIAAEILRIIYG